MHQEAHYVKHVALVGIHKRGTIEPVQVVALFALQENIVQDYRLTVCRAQLEIDALGEAISNCVQ